MRTSVVRLVGLCCALLAGAGVLALTLATSVPQARASAGSAAAAADRQVIVIGISGLRWTDISAATTPQLWRLAERGSVGNLVLTGVRTFTCPADAWLTINSGARSTASSRPGPCRLPAVGAASSTTTARIPAMNPSSAGNIESVNTPYSYSPCWGVLANQYSAGEAGCPPQHPASQAGCATAIGPGAALALASSTGAVQSYAPAAGRKAVPLLGNCRLTVVDLGRLPAIGPGVTSADRAATVRAADQSAGRIISAAPAGATMVVAGLGDDGAPHLRAIIISGPGFTRGLLTAQSTRRPGIVASTDITPTVLHWLGRSSTNLVGSVIASSRRDSLAGTIQVLIGQDTAAQVYSSTSGWYFLVLGLAEVAAVAVIALLLRGTGAARTRRRVTAYRIAMVSAAAAPAGTFLASLVPWPEQAHPALVLYGVALAFTVVIAIAAQAGPWRRDPLGSAGFVSAVTVAVIAADVITGSHLQPNTPFGLSVLGANRWYGIGNNALGAYAPAGLVTAAWAGLAGLRAGSRLRGLAGAGAVAIFVLAVCATPAFGAKVGGTIALTPAFLLLLAAIAGLRVTPLRAGLIAVSGLVLITAFAVLSFLFPAVGVSDISAFVGHVLHGSAGPVLDRKASANLHSLTETWFTPIVPVIVAATGAMIVWPERLGLRVLARAIAIQPLVRPLLTAIWVAAVLGWLADDSGVSVTAHVLPVALPLAIVIVTQFGERADAAGYEALPGDRQEANEGAVRARGTQG